MSAPGSPPTNYSLSESVSSKFDPMATYRSRKANFNPTTSFQSRSEVVYGAKTALGGRKAKLLREIRERRLEDNGSSNGSVAPLTMENVWKSQRNAFPSTPSQIKKNVDEQRGNPLAKSQESKGKSSSEGGDAVMDVKSADNDRVPELNFSAKVFKKLRDDASEQSKVKNGKSLSWPLIPVIQWPLWPVLFYFVALVAITLIFIFAFGEHQFSSFGPGFKTYQFLFWIIFLSVSFIVIHFVVRLTFGIIKGALSFSKVLFFINSVGYHYTFLVWGIVNISIYDNIYRSHTTDNVDFWVRKTFVSMIVVGALYVGVVFLSKYVTASLQRDEYWKIMMELMVKERVLAVLSESPRRRNLEGVYKPTSRGFRTAFKSLRKAYRRDSHNAKERKTSRTFEDAIELTQSIFENLGVELHQNISFSHFLPFFESEEATEKAFAYFDNHLKGETSFDEVVVAIYEIFKSRKSLFMTMDDREDIAKIITHTFKGVFWILMVIFVPIIFGVSFLDFIIPITSLVLALSFVFGDSIKSVWESFIFIFVVRPFEIGDKFSEGTYSCLTVSKISLLSTICYTSDGRMIIYPNSILHRKVIYQHKKSKDYNCYINLLLDSTTPREKIEELKDRIGQWLHQDINVSVPPLL
eukprot:TRINITY_DN2571_c0_g3_i4.p1 TRINITY_DN2571_c0_g3~~TRINITY_DN2571_c0_g3_i4.p1  ORF type:complete len:637 (-),score=159.59 TRINITY_DN2571_c0_g3_i4:529-2439(-)